MRTLIQAISFAALAVALGFAPEARAEGFTTTKSVLFDDGATPGSSQVSLVDDLRLDTGGGDSFQSAGVLPAILSFFIPGLGQIMNNQLIKGIITFGIAVVLSAIAGGTFWLPVVGPIIGGVAGIALFVWWLGNVIDAYTGNFYAFLPNSAPAIGGGSDVGVITRDERLDLVVPVARPAI